MDSSLSFLDREDAALLRAIIARRDEALLARIRGTDAIARADAERVMNTLNRELVDNLDADWEPTDYGLKVSRLMSLFNAKRIEQWP